MKENEMDRTCSKHGEKMNAYRLFIGRQEGKEPLGRARRRLDDNIVVDLKEMGGGGRYWIDLAQGRNDW
jgi:hypothetical protein